MPHRLLFTSLCLCVLLVAGCESYDFKVNDKIVYSPHPLFKDFEVSDEALRNCLEQAIVDGVVSNPSQLTMLNCGSAGIEDLDGLATFSGIKTLKLSSNSIRNLVELGSVIGLEELYLDNNQVVDPVPLYQLPALRFLDLSGNPGLQCPTSGAFSRAETVILPQHCH